jgi:hypothetical protein
VGEGLSQRLYHREHWGLTEGTGESFKGICVFCGFSDFPCVPCETSVSPVVKIYLSQSLPSTMRLMPSFRRGT